ncbi:MAG: helix-turn-helix transcriptional regulator [Deltaproteobacteria bacterium]|nr:helix-turn-helix transcriptional regulator [Deltaproteobacteria bacterium]
MRFKNLRKFFRKRYRDIFGTSITGTTAAQIRAMREKKGWSQQDLAKEAEMGQARISLLENPNYQTLSLNTLKRIANVFDVALVVRFVPFSKLFAMLDNETEETLAVPSFEEEFGTEANPIVTPCAKVSGLRLRAFYRDGAPEGSTQLKPDILYDVRRHSGVDMGMIPPDMLCDVRRHSGVDIGMISESIPPVGILRDPIDKYKPKALGETRYGEILGAYPETRVA